MRWFAGMMLMLTSLVLLTSGCARFGLFRRSETSHSLIAGPRVGAPAPEIDGEDFSGRRFKLSDYRGKVVVVTFWASWCGPCRAMIPHERQLAERFRNRPFALISVNNDENHDAARDVMAKMGVNWPNWKTTGTRDPINAAWGVESWPSVFVIDANGVLRYTRVTGPYLENAVETLLAELEAKKK